MRQASVATKRGLWALIAMVLSLMMLVPSGPASAADAGTRGKPKEQASDAAAIKQEPDRGARPRVAASREAVEALEAMQQRIEDYVDKYGTRHTFASYIDSNTGQIVLDTDAPSFVVEDLTSTAEESLDGASVGMSVRKSTTSDAWHRRDDIQPYWGGGGIRSGGGICSAGYAVEWIFGIRFSVTAGHCFADGATVTTESGANTYGTVLWRRLPTVTGHAMDAEVVYGGSYTGRIFTGGIFSMSSAGVAAAGSAYVGYSDYCHSGRTTGENCGHTATSINGQVCTQTGCKSPVIVFTGGVLPQGGDSGSPFYAKGADGRAWIRGNVIAVGSSAAYAQPWTVIQSTYGVSIVTG